MMSVPGPASNKMTQPGTCRPRYSSHVPWVLALTCVLAGCGERPQRSSGESRSPVEDSALISADRPERLVMPFAPPTAGRVVVERVAPARASLDLPPPAAEPAEPPPLETPPAPDAPILRPPIARGLPVVPRGGRGGRVMLDVRVSEAGEVTDVELVESDADSLTIEAARSAAWALRYHPAVLGAERVAVWCRQVFEVARR